MKVLKFKLWGRTAFFKKPDVNSYVYFTYGNIHKIALLGILGGIIGLKGYNQMKKNDEYPEFYEKLKNVKIAIEPNNKGAFINKKVQAFNNSVGYASQEKGGNLIVKEQWLENPSWNIYIEVKDEFTNKLEDYLCNNKAIFMPYLGKNDHYGNISEVEVIENIKEVDDVKNLNSLCPKEFVDFYVEEDEEEDDVEEDIFKYEEMLPNELDENTNNYILNSFVYSNMKVESVKNIKVYNIKGKNIVFF